MTLLSKNVYINKLDNIVNEYNNAYHRAIKINPHDVKLGKWIDFNVENDDKDPKFEINKFCKKLLSKLV